MAVWQHGGGESDSRSGLGFCAKSAGCSPASFQQTETCCFSRLTGPRKWEAPPPGSGLDLMVSAPYEPATSLNHYGRFPQKGEPLIGCGAMSSVNEVLMVGEVA